MEEIDFYLDELEKARKEWFEATNKHYAYWEQFWYSGVNIEKIEVKKSPTEEDWKVIQELEKEEDEKQEKFRKAEVAWHSFLARQSQPF